MRAGLFIILIACSLNVAAAKEQITSEQVMEWLSRVTRAGQTLNYEGTFVYRHGNRLDAIRIIHKSDGDGERERLISLNGVAREIIRNNDKVTCILPDSRSIVVDHKGPETKLPSIPGDLTQLDAHYDFVFDGYERVASRQTRRVIIRPKDTYRYGYRLWIDDAFELLLRSEMFDTKGDAIEQIMFTDIRLYETLSDDLLKPNISGKEYTWVTDNEKQTDDPMPVDTGWRAESVPGGFMVSHRNKHRLPDNIMPVDHIVYTDGLAWVSVYIEKMNNQKEILQGATSMGAVNAYARVVGDYYVTAVGEVPASTVQLIGSSVRHVNK